MNPEIRKELILSLIRDSLINIKLTSGLSTLGLNADDYVLDLGGIIFTMMEFKENEYNDMVFEILYLAMAEKVKVIDISSREKIDELALEIYEELERAKRLEFNK